MNKCNKNISCRQNNVTQLVISGTWIFISGTFIFISVSRDLQYTVYPKLKLTWWMLRYQTNLMCDEEVSSFKTENNLVLFLTLNAFKCCRSGKWTLRTRSGFDLVFVQFSTSFTHKKNFKNVLFYVYQFSSKEAEISEYFVDFKMFTQIWSGSRYGHISTKLFPDPAKKRSGSYIHCLQYPRKKHKSFITIYSYIRNMCASVFRNLRKMFMDMNLITKN